MEKMIRKTILTFLVFLFFATWAIPARAGFGVSPPTIRNRQLTPGSIFEKEIRLLRSSAEDDLKVEIRVDAPEIESWISIEKGDEFIMPKGQLQVPMNVVINIPEDAELGNYRGNINVKVLPVNNGGGGVAIALGARIDIDVALTNVSFSDFIVRVVSVPEIERLGKPFNFFIWKPLFEKLFYKVGLIMKIENIGNINTSPSKVEMEVYDISRKKLLETSADKSIKNVNPFSTSEIEAFFPTALGVGQYWSKIKIYKGSQIVNVYEVAFSVKENGELGKGTMSLGILPWILMSCLIFMAGLVVYVLIRIRVWKYFIALILIILKPSFKGIGAFLRGTNKKFWKWVSSQADKHKD